MTTDVANILLVDDKPARLLTYEAILGSLGHTLIRAGSGDEALARLLEIDVAAILLDVSMPGMDGFTTATMIREHPRSAATPIIFVTGVHLTDVDRLRGYRLGAADYISVPVLPEILRGKVQVLVQLYLQRRELTRLNDAMRLANVELAAAHAELEAESRRELQTLNSTLAATNAQLRGEVAERKRAEEQLRDSARRKDEFLAILAHELRNPLSAIHNGVQLLQGPTSPERLAWTCELLGRQLNHLTRLIDDLLDVSRITSGRVHLQLDTVDLGSVIQQSIDAVRPLIEAHKHSLRLTVPPRPLNLRGDAVRLTQVFGNLLTNACKYTQDEGSIDVVVTMENNPPAATVRISDSGAGIAPEMLERVFELFAQAEVGRTNGGLGIGLSLARALVELHGGTVFARSEGLGRGSEFVVRLPLQEAVHRAEPKPAATPSLGALQPLRILIIDDNVDAATGLAMYLREHGHDVRMEPTGEGGFSGAAEFLPEVVLLDIGLPDIDGFEVARRMRDDSRLRDVPLIAVTGFGADADRARAARIGFNEYLVKPVSVQNLAGAIARTTAGAGSRGARTAGANR